MTATQRAGPAAAHGQMDWLLRTLDGLLQCRDVAALLDLAYDAIRHGLGYDRVGLFLVDAERRVLVQRIGTDEDGHRFYPADRLSRLDDASYHALLLADPRMSAAGPGFVYLADATHELPSDLRERLDGRPGQNLQVALRTAETVRGMIAVDNLTSGRPLTPAHAPPLVAFATALTMALENVALLEERAHRIATLDADLHRRLNELEWLSEIGQRVNGAATLDDVLDVVYDGIRTGLGYDRVGIQLIDQAQGTLEERRGTSREGAKTRPTDRTFSFGPDEPILRWQGLGTLLQGAAFYYTADCYAETPEELRHLCDGQPTHTLAVPLRSGTTLTGVISVDNLTSGRPIGPRDAGPLQALAHQVATAMENARLLERERAQRAAAEAAVRVRDGFLTAASHDLRAPLTSIMGYADLMLMRLQGAQPLPAEWLGARVISLRAAAQRMIAMVDEITDAAQLQIGGRLALHMEAVELAQVLAVAIETVTQAAPPGAAVIRCDVAPGVRVPGDRARLERVMQNVIGNAVKYSPAGRTVHVSVRAHKAWVTITVRDQGVGIPADELGQVFTHFYRASTSTGIKGTGVGLAGARTIVEQHGGHITLQSAVGRGTTITIRLPRAETISHTPGDS